MTDPWKPYGEVEGLEYGVTLQYLRGPRKMGAHEVAFLRLCTLRVLPDSHTSARGRAAAIRTAIGSYVEGDRGIICAVEQVIGALVMIGATNLEMGGEPLIRPGGGKWLLLLDDTGVVEARYVKGSE